MRAAGLNPYVYYAPSKKPQGTVIAQRPRAGARVAAGASVQLNVSIGPRPKAVPNVVGKTEREAISTLQRAGFAVASLFHPVDKRAKDGIVLRQQPAAGTQAVAGFPVTIFVGQFSP
jgi:serine/threonine-protein kinase